MKNVFPRTILSAIRPICLFGLGASLIACSQADKDIETVVLEPEISTNYETQEVSDIEPVEPKELDAEIDDEMTPTLRSAESHVHGGANLSIVSEQGRVFIELETPLYNLLGFEYTPQTEAEKTKVRTAEARLAEPEKLFRFNAEAQCSYNKLKSAPTLFDASSKSDHGHGDRHDHHHDEKTDEHDEHHHHDHDDEQKADHDHAEHDHKDVILTYSMTCENLEALKTVQIEFFEYFPNFTELDLVYLGPSQQMSAELSPSRPSADLTQ